jgi:dihydroorotate dehydrogenase (fumarate)/dihydroorotate dehydrogenase
MSTFSLYESLFRPLLFRLTPDASHELARAALRLPWLWQVLGRASRIDDARLSTELAGLRLANPVGLAPGFDKNAELVPSLRRLGFGYIVVGSITPDARTGNPFPRLVRYPNQFSIANSMGMPNRGLADAVRLLRSLPADNCCPVIASVAGFSAEELLIAAEAVKPHVSAVEIGLVCPNTTESERMDELRTFNSVAEGLAKGIVREKPVFIKLPPHHSDVDRERVYNMLDVCLRVGIQGVSVSGTRPVVEPGLGMGKGSLAGHAVFDDTVRITREVTAHVRGGLAVKSAGGVFSGAHALELLQAGASTVEVYSAFIYRGWDVAGRINRELGPLLGPLGLRGLRRVSTGAELEVSGAPSPHA